VDRHRLDDIAPYLYRTHDFGKTWTKITTGIPDGAFVRAVREDRVRKGLLFAGTELGVYFSLDDGEHWQPLRLNMPVTPVHDLAIKDNDLIAATHGRSFWILDDISPLRQIDQNVAPAAQFLFKPAAATRVRRSTNHDTPLTPEISAGENPPPGAIFYYRLGLPATEIRIDILDARDKVVRSYSSKDRPWSPSSPPPFPDYWFRPAEQLSTAVGTHRFVWDLHYTAPSVTNRGYSMSTVFGRSVPVEPEGPAALPGEYKVRLTVYRPILDGVESKQTVQSFTVTMDPRVKATAQDLQKQFALEKSLADGIDQANQVTREIRDARAAGTISDETERNLAGGGGRRGQEDSGTSQQPSLSQIIGAMSQLLTAVDSADAAPTIQATRAAEQALQQLQAVLTEWKKVKR